MYAICSTKKEDVARCVAEMVAKGYKFPVIQFGVKKYNQLEKDRGQVMEACGKVQDKAEHVINLDTRKVHKKDCKKKGKNVVGAKLISIKSTGLMNCMLCMR